MINEQYLVVRYAPGVSLDDTWTGFADIGTAFDGHTLTEDEYLEVENKYLYVHSVFMQQAGVQRLTVLDLEIDDRAPARWSGLREDAEISADDAVQLLRPLLREQISARLEVADTFYLHVGYDMMTYVGTTEPVPYAVDEAGRIGLFVEENVPSPMIPDPAERFWWLTDGAPVRHRVSSFDKVSGKPLDRYEIPDSTLPSVLAAVPAHADDPSHWDKYALTPDQLARILPELGLRADPERSYTLVSYSDE